MSTVDPTVRPSRRRSSRQRGRALIAAAAPAPRRRPRCASASRRDRTRARTAAPAAGRSRVLVPAGGLLAAAIVAVAIATSGRPAEPCVGTARIAARGPVLPAPKEDPANPALLERGVDGVPFPLLGRRLSPSGRSSALREDAKVEDPAATQTVYYQNRSAGARGRLHDRVGDALEPPDGSRRARTVNGVPLRVTEDGAQRS